ncbi:conserved hypothetical protein [Aster yellows witches'-broom phytoplasma AYWB]|uniref:Uncharacterized protein n=1 Tax=Aster yellows witches'-broom phytoplasma (strain AYWB) TaxID=322098 RepID=Q2NJ54_AYWBP|nr:hypothetical protein [Aster yellows witches'-broom phytoplasma]ABC65539.1 conserved hypothetical protein [Aster yellows witches'-broom phytoplasma AYWB]
MKKNENNIFFAQNSSRHYNKPLLHIQIAVLFHNYNKNDTLVQQKPHLTQVNIQKYNKKKTYHFSRSIC